MEGLVSLIIILLLFMQSLTCVAADNSCTRFRLQRNGKDIEPPSGGPLSTTFEASKSGKLLFASTPGGGGGGGRVVQAGMGNSFVGAIYQAYSYHYALRIRPDDAWLAIVVAWAGWVDAHAEEMRTLFVSHEGKKPVTVLGSTMGEHMIERLGHAVEAEISESARGFVDPAFSTTTPKDKLVARSALLGAVQKYFGYRVMLMCGIPEVIMMGTPADWRALRDKIVDMAVRWPMLKQWTDALLPIADQWIASAEGAPTEDFWQRCVSKTRYGSGGQGDVSGWVLAFAPWDDKGQWRLNVQPNSWNYGSVSDDLFSHAASISFPVSVNDHGDLYEARFHVGGYVNTFNDSEMVIAPSFDYAFYRE